MNLLEINGGQPQKQPTFVPIFIDKQFTGLMTQRNVLHDPSDLATAKFYGGRPDALWQGLNIELTNRLTLQRRPGLSPFSTATYSTPPLRAFSFQLINGTIQVIIDTGSTGNLAVTSVANSSGSTAVYTGTFPLGILNGYVGMIFVVTGFAGANNNGTFTCVASTATTLTLSNIKATAETLTASAISSGAVYVDNQNGTKTLIFGKAPGAGQTYFVAVAGILYMGDGVETKKYTPLNTNGIAWNWGGATPTSSPAVSITQAAVSTVPWQALTWFSTMGIIIDSNGNAQQLISINALGTNLTQFGTAASGAPPWNQNPGATTTDGGVTWQNKGPVSVWTPNTVFGGVGSFGTTADPAVIYDVNTNAYYHNSRNGPTTSGPTKPPFNGVPGSHYFDGPIGNYYGGCNWVCIGSPTGPYIAATWTPSTFYSSNLVGLGIIIEPVSPPELNQIPPAVNQISYAQYALLPGGTSAASYSHPNWSTLTGDLTLNDKDLTWVNLGSSVWAPGTSYKAWSSPRDSNFSVVVDSVGQLQVCIQGGVSSGVAPWHVWVAGATVAVSTTIIDSNGNRQFTTAGGTSQGGTHPTWATTAGSPTTDNTVTWTCLGPAYGFTTTDNTVIWVDVGSATNATWTASQKYYLPKIGFSPPTASSSYGGAAVIDPSNNEQFTIVTGVSQTPGPPTWAAVGLDTVDSTVLWYNDGTAISKFITWTTGYNYAYSYKARSLTDFYSVDVTGTSYPPVPPGLTDPLPAPTGSETGLITTASPVFTITGGNAGALNSIYGNYSADPQFDTIVIWRSADGGSVAQMFELTEIQNIPAKAGTGAYTVNGIKYDWVFQDYLPDLPTNLYPGLNELIPAPIADSNDPPPATFLPMVYNFQRIWGADGQDVLFTGGPDVITGNPNEAMNPIYNLPFLANVVRLVKTSQGIVTFLTDSIEFIAGGPTTASFFSVTLAPGTGLSSYNALDQFAGEIYFFSSDNRLCLLSPALNLSNSGFPIGDQLANLPSSGVSDATWNPANVYVAIHQDGIDNCLIIADGSTGWYRQNPHQVPGGAQGAEPVWSPFAGITAGCKMVQSVETTPGTKRLLVGGTGASTGTVPQGAINLASASTYGVLAGTTITNTGATVITGNLGLSPGSSVTGSPTVTGVSNVDNPAAVQAKADLTAAYLAAAALSSTVIAAELGGVTLTPGVYSSASGAFSITSSDLTLNAGGNANATFIFITASTLIVGNSRTVTLANSASAANVIWIVGSSATIGTSATFNGTILALTSITVNTSATVAGGMLARNGAVTLDTNTVAANAGSNIPVGVPGGYGISKRDLKLFTDNGASYDAWFTMGSITLAHPGQLSILKFFEMDFSGVSYKPVVSYLLNEISGTFKPFVLNPVFDPPSLYGTTIIPTTYSPNRYYFSGQGSLARCRHMQLKVDLGTTPNGDELFDLTIFGRLLVEV